MPFGSFQMKLLGETTLKEKIKLPHDLGNVLFAVDLIRVFAPLLSGVLQQLIKIARFVYSSLRASARDLSTAHTFNPPLADLLTAL